MFKRIHGYFLIQSRYIREIYAKEVMLYGNLLRLIQFFLTCSEYDFLLFSSYSLREEFKIKKRPPSVKRIG